MRPAASQRLAYLECLMHAVLVHASQPPQLEKVGGARGADPGGNGKDK